MVRFQFRFECGVGHVRILPRGWGSFIKELGRQRVVEDFCANNWLLLFGGDRNRDLLHLIINNYKQ